MGRYIGTVECPNCGSRSGCATYQNGSAFCFSCRKNFKSIDNPTEGYSVDKEKQHKPFFTVEEIQSFPIADLSHRKIRKEICELYGVRQAVDEMTGEPKHIFFPSGKQNGYKRKNRKIKEDMSIYGKYSGLFGQNVCGKGKMLVITEGEEDCLAAYQMFVDAGKKWKVASLPNGANQDGKLDKATLEEYDYLKGFEVIVLCFDQDKNGKATVEGFADVLAGEVDIRVMEFSEKDANDMLKADKGAEFLRAFYNAREYRPEKMEKGGDVAFEEIHKAIPKGVFVPTFPKLMDRMRGLRPEEMTFILAPSGVGKSSFCREIVYSLLQQGKSVANIFLEETTTKTRQGLIALDNNVPLWKYRENPSLIPEENARKSYDNIIASGRCHFVRHRGSLSDTSLLSLIKWYRSVERCDFIVLDHISMVLSGRRSNNERVEIDGLLTDLAAIVEETGVHLIVVSHIKRMMNKVYVKDEVNAAEWLFIDLDAARGSGAFEQLSWNIITLEPEKTEIGERGRTRINIRKNREIGAIGPCDIIKMDSMTGRMVAIEEEQEF